MLEIGRQIERYEVEEALGEGGMAFVFKVRHLKLGTLHALKVLKVGGPAIQERLVREGKVQASLKHANILAVTDVIDVDGAPGLLMEYVGGGSLDQWLEGRRPTTAEAESIFRGILAGVGRAHKAGLIHRDLKPGNVLMEDGEDGFVPKVADFGLAKILADTGGRNATRSGVGMGTPAYMSPEQIRDAKNVDGRADIFALGCILYELVCGSSPFQRGDVLSIFAAIADGRYVPPEEHVPGLPGHLGAAMRACLHADRERRVADCAGLLAILNGKSPVPPPGIGTSPALGASLGSALAATGGLATVGGPAPVGGVGTGSEPLALAVGEPARPAVAAETAVPRAAPQARSGVAAPTWHQDEAAARLGPPESLLLEPEEYDSTARLGPPDSLLLEPEEDRAPVDRAALREVEVHSEAASLPARPAVPDPAAPLAERQSLGHARAETPPPAVGGAVPRGVRAAALGVLVVLILGVLGVGGAVTSSLPSAGPGAVIPGALAPDPSVPGATTTGPTVPAPPSVGTGEAASGALATPLSTPAVAPAPPSPLLPPTMTMKSGPAKGATGTAASTASVAGRPTGSLRVSGDARKVQLVGGASIFHAGDAIPAGVYTVRAEFPAGNVIELVGLVTIRAGATTDLVCDSSFDNCHL